MMGGRNRWAVLATTALLTGALAAPAAMTWAPGASALPASAARRATMTDLGTLGGTYSSGEAINALGQVTGQADAAGAYHAFRWTA